MSANPSRLRVVTANVQSFPEDALSEAQALEDLTRNAEVGDLVLLQEIVARYRPLVEQAFPATAWTVYYGRPDNTTPIAFRRDLFTKVRGQVTLLHPAVAARHGRRYQTHLELRHRDLDCDLHALNLHLVAGAFNDTPLLDKAERVEEWQDAVARHRESVEKLAATGVPVVGGGDYNRQLRQDKPLGAEIAGRPVRYAVDPGSIDLLWFVDGTSLRWDVDRRTVYPGRGHRSPQRNSDHGARTATVRLDAAPRRTSKPVVVRTHPPFERTTYGDVRPKCVDWKTRAALEEAERRLGYRLTVVQGSYNAGGVSQSAGTHDGGGVVDLLAWDWQRKVRVLRSIGFAAWYRPTIPGLWGAHIHAVLVDHGQLSRSAAAQVASYRAGRDGLKGNARDTFWRPDPIPVFAYPPPRQDAGTPPVVTPAPEPTPVPGASPYPPRRELDGVDTSHWQSGRIDLAAARASGLQWWYVKATEGDGYVDPTYADRVRQARKAGVPVGAYHFARPDRGDARREAEHFLGTVDLRAGDMLPMLDLESTEGLSPSELTRWTGTWVETVARRLTSLGLAGRPIIYTPFDLERGFGCLCWVARYSNDFRAPRVPRPWKQAAIWQHSNGRYGPVRHVPGFGPVDVNAVHPDVPLAALRLRAAGAGAEPPSVPRPRRPEDRPGTRPDARPDHLSAADLADVRSSLVAAARSIEAAVDLLPER